MTSEREFGIEKVQRRHADPPPISGEARPTITAAQEPPNRRGYALGWLAASQIVADRFLDSAIDAIPVLHPERGWDRILITRRTSCRLLGDEPSNAFGMIELASRNAPRLTNPDGEVLLSLGDLFEADATNALDKLRAHFARIGLVEGDHAECAHQHATNYPHLYGVIARLIADYPDLTAAREIVVDDQIIDGAYHPLYVHTAERGEPLRYDWFALQSASTGFTAFVRINGRQSVFRTDRHTWASPQVRLNSLSEAEVRRTVLSWLRVTPGPVDQT